MIPSKLHSISFLKTEHILRFRICYEIFVIHTEDLKMVKNYNFRFLCAFLNYVDISYDSMIEFEIHAHPISAFIQSDDTVNAKKCVCVS